MILQMTCRNHLDKELIYSALFYIVLLHIDRCEVGSRSFMQPLEQVTVLGATYLVSKALSGTGWLFCSEEAARRVVIVQGMQAAEQPTKCDG